MDNKEKMLTLDEAYDAIVDYLDKYYQKTESDDLALLLGDMLLFADDSPVDNAALLNWNDSVSKIKNQAIQNVSRLTLKEAYDAMIDYLDDYRNRINSDEIADLLSNMIVSEDKTITNPAWNDWANSVDNILNQNPRTRPRLILTKPDDEE